MTAWPLVPWLVAALVEDGRRSDPGTALQRWRGLALVAVLAGSVVGATPGPVVLGAALAVAAGGIALRAWTIRILGRGFRSSPIPIPPFRPAVPSACSTTLPDTALVVMALATWVLGSVTLWAVPGLLAFGALTALQVREEQRCIRSYLGAGA